MSLNSEKYHFTDFTRANYRRLLQLAKAKYTIREFQSCKDFEKFIVIRHDCDASIHSARELAKIECDLGIRATYFVMLNNEFYNLLERDARSRVSEILEMGHKIGVHFDADYYAVHTESELERWLNFERDILQSVFSTNVEAFSFHIPTEVTAGFKSESYSGMINVYSKWFSENVGYCSDSNGYWRHRRLEDVLESGMDEKLQILIHPEHWQAVVMSPRERILKCIEGRSVKTLARFERVLEKSGRPLLDWVSPAKETL